MRIYQVFIFLIISGFCSQYLSAQNYDTAKPWTYWWWPGSAVNEADIDHQLTAFAKAGLGGVHIIPIYGVKGEEAQFLPFLSAAWLEAVQFTLERAEELELGVDITLGTGWPYGGPWVGKEESAKRLVTEEFEFPKSNRIQFSLDSLDSERVEYFAAFATNTQGERLDWSTALSGKKLDEKVPLSDWKLSFFGITNTRQQVKRAAPGGEGLVLDYFDENAIQSYLHHFDSIFAETPLRPRAFYHDSYETYGANWTSDFVQEFEKKKGYNITSYLPVLADEKHEQHAFVKHDVREVLSSLLTTEFAETWTDWVIDYGAKTRYQAHGSPGNILDLYALSDIPETESFGCSDFDIPGLQCDPDYEEDRFGRPSPLMMKFASSPAHLLGKPLVSSETTTWLGNHFKVSLRQVKPQIDELLVSGINHIFYHGATYSQPAEGFPGWLFYASTNFNLQSHFWEELPLLNNYIAECQKRLQQVTPDNDILLYFPIHDLWTTYPGDPLLLLDVHKYRRWFGETAFGQTASQLWEAGYAFDYISDQQLEQLQVSAEQDLYLTENRSYQTIVVPKSDYISRATLERLQQLAQSGAKIVFVEQLPENFASLGEQEAAETVLPKLHASLKRSPGVQLTTNLLTALDSWDIRQEPMKQQGLDFLRKQTEEGHLYFVTNLSDQFYSDRVQLAVATEYVEVFEPSSGKRYHAEARDGFYLELLPGQSCFVQTFEEQPDSPTVQSLTAQDTLTLQNDWTVEFISGNTENLRSNYTLDTLRSWTEWGDAALDSLCGKGRYRTTFMLDDVDATATYRLLFDNIHETAQVTINGIDCGTVWHLPLQLDIPPGVLQAENTLEITVQNLSANRIRQVDQSGRNWKKFYDINFVDIQYKPFDASDWALQPSGLVGQVRVVRLE